MPGVGRGGRGMRHLNAVSPTAAVMSQWGDAEAAGVSIPPALKGESVPSEH